MLARPPGVGGYVFAPLSHGAVIQPATITIATMLAAWLLLGEAMSRARLAGAAVIVVSLALLAAAKDGTAGERSWIGDPLFVGASLSWIAFTLLLRRRHIVAVPATAA